MGRLGPVFGRNHAIAIRVQAIENLQLLFRREFSGEFPEFELLEADAAAFINVQLPKTLEVGALAIGGFAHPADFGAAEFAISVFVQAIEKRLTFGIGQVLNSRESVEFLLGNQAIAVLISVFPSFPEARAALGAGFLRWRPSPPGAGFCMAKRRQKKAGSKEVNDLSFHGG
jgi:hypothetical protein